MIKNPTYKLLASLLMLALTAGLTLTACTSIDDNPVTNPTADADDENHDYVDGNEEGAPEDPLGDFMAHFTTTTDADGHTQPGAYGQALDEADPTVLSIGAESAEEAEQTFRHWVTDTLHLLTVAPGNLVYTPTTPDGQRQGTIYFNRSSDCLARITFGDDLPHDEVSEIRFIDRRLWPDNGETLFTVGREYVFMRSGDHRFFVDVENLQVYKDEAYSMKCYRCVDDGGEGRPALLWCSSYIKWGAYSYDTNIESQNVSSIIHGGSGYGMWNTKTKGNGTWVRSVWNSKKGMGDGHVLPNLSSLEEISLYIQRNSSILDKYYGNSWDMRDDIFWSNDHCKSGLSFHFYGFIMGQHKKDHWRAYTHLGRWSEVAHVKIGNWNVRANDLKAEPFYLWDADQSINSEWWK